MITSSSPDRSIGDEQEPKRSRTRTPATRAEKTVLIVGFVGLTAAVVGTRWGTFTPDTRPDLYEQPGRFVAESLQAWIRGPLGLGQSNFNAGAVPVGAVIWVIRTLGAPAWLAVRLWRLGLLVLAAWGIRRHLDTLLGDRLSPTARLLATVFWVVNPYVIVAGNTTPILLPYALLPWTMLAFVRAGRQGGWRWPALFALGFFAQGGLNAGVVPFFQLAALPAHAVHLRRVEGIRWRPILAAVLRCGLLSILVSLYWLAPSFLASGTGASIASSTEKPTDVARTSSYVETARGLGQWALYGRSGDRLFLGGYTIYLTDRLVIAATLAVTTTVAFVLHRSRSALRLLAALLLATALPLMVGLFPIDASSPAGSALGWIFRRVPATMAFRTTNKVGAVAMLGIVVALALGAEGLRRRLHGARLGVRMAAVGGVVLLLAGISAPMWNGSLYPLDYEVPKRWRTATADLDADGDGRVLVVPGGTGGNYRWGLRSPDDLFPSHLHRPVVSRNTVVGAADPAGNFLTWFDTDLQQGTLPPTGVSTIARLLGADRVVNRNDVLSEETEGARPSVVASAVASDPGLSFLRGYGEPGTDTVAGSSGPADADDRARAPGDAALTPIEVFAVDDPLSEITVSDTAGIVLVDGDGAAFGPLVELGLLHGLPPVRYAGDLDADELERIVHDGARLVLTDTNQRRAWDINRLRNASSQVLTAEEAPDSGSGPSITLWPGDLDRQTIADLGPTVTSVTSRFESFGIRPWGKPVALVDGNETTAFWTGGIISPLGGSVDIDLREPTEIRSIAVQIRPTEPARITELTVGIGDRYQVVTVPPGREDIVVPIDPVETDQIEIAITGITPGLNPVGIAEVRINDGAVRALDRLRIPRTVPALLDSMPSEQRRETEEALEAVPIDIVLTRLRGQAGNTSDDEEPGLNRLVELPVDRTLTFAATLEIGEIDPEIVTAARAGDARCQPVAELDGEPILARITDLDHQSTTGRVRLEGCDPLTVDAGTHEYRSVFGWRIDRVHLADQTAFTPADRTSVRVRDDGRGRRTVLVPEGSGPRLLRTGIGFDPRWRLEVDGRDLGPPILLDGYAAAWRIGAEGGEMSIVFPPQTAGDGAFVASAGGLAVTIMIAFLPGLPSVGRRRRSSHTGAPDGAEEPGP